MGSAHTAEGLDIDEFIEFYRLISYTRVLDKEFECLADGEIMSMKKFKKFLVQSQKFDENTVEQLCNQLISKYEPFEANKEKVRKTGHVLSSKGFRNILLSPQFDIVLDHVQTVHQDMTRPLVDYYIATSHNS